LIDTTIGEDCAGPAWFDESGELNRIQKPAFASAVHAVAAVKGSHTAATERQLRMRLRKLARISFVSTLKHVYRIGRSKVPVATEVAVEERRIVLMGIRSRSELSGLLARAIASLADGELSAQQSLADSVYRLLTCNSNTEIEHYLAQRGIEWSASTRDKQRADADEFDDEDREQRERIGEALKEKLLTSSATRAQDLSTDISPEGSNCEPAIRQPRSISLPPLREVDLVEITLGDWSAPDRAARLTRGPSVGLAPRTPAEVADDCEVGARGEELVYFAEVKRVADLGYPPRCVIWTSKTNPTADHDIHSITDDGGDLWLEVKSTTGRHGRFDWSRAEFERALQARARYVLCRVYEADSKRPTVVRIADPIGQLSLGKMRLDISNLSAEVAPLSAELSATAPE